MRFNQSQGFFTKKNFKNYVQFSSTCMKGNNIPATTTRVRTSPALLSLHTLFLCDLNHLRAGSSAKSCKVNNLANHSKLKLRNHTFTYF